jgi:alpha-L-fucosidase
VTTRRGDSVFVHVLDWSDDVLSLPDLGVRVVSASMLRDGARVKFTQSASSLTIELPHATPDDVDRVVVLETRKRNGG